MERICANPECDNVVSPNAGPGRPRKWCSNRCRKLALYSGICEVCGAPTSGTASGRGRRATRFCKLHGQQASSAASTERSAEARAQVEAMWAEGKSIKEIATAMGVADTTGYISRMRASGYNLPHRRKRGVAAMQVGGRAGLVKARAMRGQPYTLAQCAEMVTAWALKYHRTPTAQDAFHSESLPGPFSKAIQDLGGWHDLMAHCELPVSRSPSSGKQPEPADAAFAWREYGNLKDVAIALRLKPEAAEALLKRSAEGRRLLEGQELHGSELAHARAEDSRASQPVAPPRERTKRSPARAARAAVAGDEERRRRRRRTEAAIERAMEQKLDVAQTDDCTCVFSDEQTEFDPACPYHGDNGTMVARIRPSSELRRAERDIDKLIELEEAVPNNAIDRARSELRAAQTELEAKVNELEEQLSPLRKELEAVRAATYALDRTA